MDDDMDDFPNDAESTWRQWAENRRLPPYSRKFRPLIDSRAPPGGRYVENINSFFIPSYLRGSKYAKKLEDAHRAKAAVKKNHSRDPSSTSNGPDVLRKAASYNGVTLELIEKAPPRNPDEPESLPSKMNVHDRHKDVEVLADGLEIKFTQHTCKDPVGSPESLRAYSIRADTVIPQESGIYYFEVTILTRNSDEYGAILSSFC